MSELLRCRAAFYKNLDGKRVLVKSGDIVYADDPVVKGSEKHFVPVEQFAKIFGKRPAARRAAPVEQATADPGEVRTTKRPRKPVASPKEAVKEDKDA